MRAIGTFRRHLVVMGIFRDRAPEIVPHLDDDRLDFGVAYIGISGAKILRARVGDARAIEDVAADEAAER